MKPRITVTQKANGRIYVGLPPAAGLALASIIRWAMRNDWNSTDLATQEAGDRLVRTAEQLAELCRP